MRKSLFVAMLLLVGGQLAQAGIIRHVVRPVVSHGKTVTVKTVRVAAHGAKAIVY